MRLKTVLSLLAVALMTVACCLPWLRFQTKGITFRGIDEMRMVVGTTTLKEINWGRPGYFHLFWAVVFLLLLFIKKGWAKWAMLAAAAFNIAWTVRNFFLLPACGGGDCPVKAMGLYLLPAAAIFLFVAATLEEPTQAAIET